MSYILDALKQSERQRSRHPAESGLPLPPEPGGPARMPFYRRWWWWLLVILVLALLAGYGLGRIGSGWLELSPAPPLPAAGEQQAPQAEAEPAASAPPAQVAERSPIIIDSPPVRILVDDPPALSLTAPGPVTPPAPAAPPASAPVVAPAPPEPPFDPGVPDLRELPANIRARLPALTLSVHIYSATPASRMANINGQMLREGQQLGALQLRSITPRGVILSFEGQEFHLNSVGG